MNDSNPNPRKDAFNVALDTRKLEIQLFWSRSLFFWGFIAASFTGYAALTRIDSGLSLIVASFGLVCSAAWSLVNRGGKYWQEAWEQKIARLEPTEPEALFAKTEPPQLSKGCWLRGRHYSVSKLAIALSDYTTILWASLISWHIVQATAPDAALPWLKSAGTYIFIGFSAIYVVLMLIFCRSTPRT